MCSSDLIIDSAAFKLTRTRPNHQNVNDKPSIEFQTKQRWNKIRSICRMLLIHWSYDDPLGIVEYSIGSWVISYFYFLCAISTTHKS